MAWPDRFRVRLAQADLFGMRLRSALPVSDPPPPKKKNREAWMAGSEHNPLFLCHSIHGLRKGTTPRHDPKRTAQARRLAALVLAFRQSAKAAALWQ